MLLETLFAAGVGAALYGGIELAWRGRTHWTMLLAGGTCFAVMYLIATRTDWPLWGKWVSSAAVCPARGGATEMMRLGLWLMRLLAPLPLPWLRALGAGRTAAFISDARSVEGGARGPSRKSARRHHRPARVSRDYLSDTQ